MNEGNSGPVSGVIPALVTPLDEEGEVETKALEALIGWYASSGVTGLLANGTTGEGAYLSVEEQVKILEVVTGAKRPDQLLYVACLQPYTAQVVASYRAIKRFDPDFLLVPPPFYHVPDQDAIRRHFEKISDAVDAPIIIYNIPQHTHVEMAYETIAELSRNPRIVGIKDSSGQFAKFVRGLSRNKQDNFSWVQSDDRLMGAAVSLGCSAVVTGLGNVSIEPHVRLINATSQDEILQENRRIDSLFDIIRVTGYRTIQAIKFGLAQQGRCKAVTKLGPIAFDKETERAVKSALKREELL